MGLEDDGFGPRKRRKISSPKSAPYVLRPLLEKVPLTSDDSNPDVHITCTEYWDGNLYIGTSSAEILHYVCLPADPSDESNEPSFIFASRLPIHYSSNTPPTTSHNGVQQIVLLPTAKKACILCNGTLTFYMLPELSPAFLNTSVSKCSWVGGLDLNETSSDGHENSVVMIAVRNRIMLVRIGQEARRIRDIEFPGCLVASRRGTIACVADAHAYSLVDVEHKAKIDLFPISSSGEITGSGHVENMVSSPSPSQQMLNRTSSPYSGSPTRNAHDHTRSSSSGALHPDTHPSQLDRSSSATPDSAAGSKLRSASESQKREGSASPTKDSENRDLSSNSGNGHKPLPPLPKQGPAQPLKPHVVSPTPSEFLLITGSEKNEPGIGMFVNIDGEVVPGSTMTFRRYPESVAVDGSNEDSAMQPQGESQGDYILAVIEDGQDGKPCKRLEVQRFDVNPGEDEREKAWVEIPSTEEGEQVHVGVRRTTSPSDLEFHEMGRLLRMVRLKTPSLPDAPLTDPKTQAIVEQNREGSPTGWEAERNAEEARIARPLGKVQSSLILWSGSNIWRVLRNPLTTQLDDAIKNAQKTEDNGRAILDRDSILDIIGFVQDMEPRSEAEFLGLNYAKQKASLLLFGDLLFMDPAARTEAVLDDTEQALVVGELDPRIVLLLVPSLREEVLQSPHGIWIPAGLAAAAESHLQQVEDQGSGTTDSAVLNMVKRFLFSWQQKRGYGSITDDTYIFDSVDNALLHLLLEQDSKSVVEGRVPSLVRAELLHLVDHWKGNFDKAVALTEKYNRLYILSRLYQSRKMSRNVLRSWQRIIEGEKDIGGEITPSGVEAKMREYLVKIKDAHLVEEYGSWLAGRNPNLGIQVFADRESRVKLEPANAVALLKERAPNAVQVYLEHLVFAKNYSQYADDLIGYYLDTVLSVLHSSEEARTSLSESYSTYRALHPPKPTYMNFIADNAPLASWWQSRLRLLQLLGGWTSTQFTSTPTPSNLAYSIPTVLERIEPFQNELVSECIILDGLQGRHREALRLLTHGLGDYDSAIGYCVFGGPRHATSTGTNTNTNTDTDAPTKTPEKPQQTDLFKHLLDEFLRIRDVSERIERTSDLLARFAPCFDVREVLALIPDDWSVDILGEFLVHVFRSLLSQTREARMERSLSASLNLRVSTEYIEGVEKVGGYVENNDGLRNLRGGELPPSQASPEHGHVGEDGGAAE